VPLPDSQQHMMQLRYREPADALVVGMLLKLPLDGAFPTREKETRQGHTLLSAQALNQLLVVGLVAVRQGRVRAWSF
jgi:hypothetical protein